MFYIFRSASSFKRFIKLCNIKQNQLVQKFEYLITRTLNCIQLKLIDNSKKKIIIFYNVQRSPLLANNSKYCIKSELSSTEIILLISIVNNRKRFDSLLINTINNGNCSEHVWFLLWPLFTRYCHPTPLVAPDVFVPFNWVMGEEKHFGDIGTACMLVYNMQYISADI